MFSLMKEEVEGEDDKGEAEDVRIVTIEFFSVL